MKLNQSNFHFVSLGYLHVERMRRECFVATKAERGRERGFQISCHLWLSSGNGNLISRVVKRCLSNRVMEGIENLFQKYLYERECSGKELCLLMSHIPILVHQSKTVYYF